jgi:REP element-mobilizing transposase RayT
MQKKSHSGTGVPPVHSFKVTRRNLPHWQNPNGVYFITWRCCKNQILTSEERTITLEALKYWDGRKWTIYAAVVMPDHVHLLAQPLSTPKGGFFDLAEIIHSIKSFTVHKVNKIRGVRGSLWQDERFDRIVRDDKELLEKWHYLRHNPTRDGLVSQAEDYPWLYERT